MEQQFAHCEPLPAIDALLSNLSRARSSSGDGVELALASSTKSGTYQVKTSKPEVKRLLSYFTDDRRILGDDPRVRQGRGKPAPDIYMVALESLNASNGLGCVGKDIRPDECLVFEDSVAGVEAGRRAGMRVVWVPHPDVAAEWQVRQKDALMGKARNSTIVEDGPQLGDIDNSWAERIMNLEHFEYGKYGIHLQA
nr:putative uncharacterized hydrolase [Quercus suber]